MKAFKNNKIFAIAIINEYIFALSLNSLVETKKLKTRINERINGAKS